MPLKLGHKLTAYANIRLSQSIIDSDEIQRENARGSIHFMERDYFLAFSQDLQTVAVNKFNKHIYLPLVEDVKGNLLSQGENTGFNAYS